MPIATINNSALGNYTIIPNGSSFPTGTSRYPGRLVFQADLQTFWWWDGATWQILGTGGGGSSDGGPNLFVVASSTADATIQGGAHYICDGSADEVEINNALSRGNVLLTDGDYSLSTPILMTKPGSALFGAGLGEDMGAAGGRGFGTLIKLVSGFTGVAGILISQGGVTPYPAGQTTVANLKVDGTANKTASPGGNIHGIRVRSYQANVYCCDVRQVSGDGFNIRGFSSSEITPNGWATYDSKFNMLHAKLCGGAGFNCDTGSADIHVSNSIFENNDGDGIERSGGASMQVTNVHCYGNLNGINFAGTGSRDKIANCKIEHNTHHGILFDGTTTGTSGVQIVATGFNCNGTATDNTYSHIAMTGSQQQTSVVIALCEFGNSDGVSNLAKYCIDLSSVGVGVTVTGCHFGTTAVTSGARTGKINFSGSNPTTKLQISGCNNHQDKHSSPTTTIAAGAGAGTSPPAPIITGNDQRGSITWGTGTGPTGGIQATVTFGFPWELAGLTPIVVPANTATAALVPFVAPADTSQTTWSFRCGTAPAASQGNTVYALQYHLMS